MYLDSCLGIEFGKRRLVLAMVRKGWRGWTSGPYLVIEDQTSLSEAELAGRVRNFLQKPGVATDRVIVAVSRSSVVVREFDFPLDVEENLEGVVRQQVAKLEPVEEATSVYAYRVQKRDPEAGRLLLQVAMIREDQVHRLLDRLAGWDLYPEAVIFSTVALESLLGHVAPRKRSGPWLVLRGEGEESELAVVAPGGRVYSSHPERGLNPAEPVERYLEETAGLLSPVAEEFPEFERCLVLGDELVRSFDQIRAAVGDCERLAKYLEGLAGGVPPGDLDRLAIAWGAALVGLRRGGPWCNLVPSERRVVHAKAGWGPTIVLAAALVVLVVLLGLRGYWQQRVLADEIDLQLAAIQPAAEEVSDLRSRLEQRRAELEELASLLRGRQRILLVLKDLTERIPEDTYLQNLQIQGDQLTMQGYSPQASALLPLLTQSPFLESVKTNWIQQDARQGGLERFNFSARIRSGDLATR